MVGRMTFVGLLLAGCSGCLPPPEEDVSNATDSPQGIAEDRDGITEDGSAEDVARQDSNASDEVRVKAETGVGRRGRGYGGGMVTEPIRQYFRVQQRMQFILMDKAIRDYKTLNGRMPKTHDEFMKEIIKANAIRLPELPDGEEYIYDPEQEELMVRRPQ